MALSAVETAIAGVLGEEDAGPARGLGTLLAQTRNLAVLLDPVELHDPHAGLHTLVGNLLGGRVGFLLFLLGTAAETQHQVQGGLFLDVVVREGASILELLAGKDEALLIRGNPYWRVSLSGGRMSVLARGSIVFVQRLPPDYVL